MKYIDAEKLKAEIDKLHDAPVPKHDQQCDFSDGYSWGLNDIENLIDSLQQEQPEVELEGEITRFLSNATKMNKGEWRGKYPIGEIGFRAVAHHFYELGLKARKEK